jgi:hypothetical protein
MSSIAVEGAEDHPIQPSILVPRKRTRGEVAVQAARDQNMTRRRRRAVPLQLQPLAPPRPDTPPAIDSGFQETLLAEGCGSITYTLSIPLDISSINICFVLM